MTRTRNSAHLRASVLFYLAVGWFAGVASCALWGNIWWAGTAGTVGAGVAAALMRSDIRYALLGIATAALLIAGGSWYQHHSPPDEPTGVAQYNDAAVVRIRGLVTEEPDIAGRSQRVRLDAHEIYASGSWQPTEGGVLLRTGQFPRYRYGDVLNVAGKLETPPSFPDFDYREYLAMRGVQSLMAFGDIEVVARDKGNPAKAALISVRGSIGDALERVLPEPQAALAAGIFAGERSSIPDTLTTDMNATGTSHLVAVSGQNIAIVAALTIAGLAWLIGRRSAAMVALFAIAGYAALTGGSPSIVRAAIMGALFVTATLVGRPASAAIPIALAAAVMTALDPLVVHDVSFQLSFAAVLGLIYLAPAFESFGAGVLRSMGIEPLESRSVSFLVEGLAITAAAIAATEPLIALHFGRVSLIAPLANLPLVAAFPLILVGSGITAVATLIWEPLGELAAWPTWLLLTYMTETVRFFAGLPAASVSIEGFGRWHAALIYSALAVLGWRTAHRPLAVQSGVPLETPTRATGVPRATLKRGPLIRPYWLVATGLAIMCALTWNAALGSSGGRLTVTVLDVGQGDAILIETPSGRTAIVDGGASGLVLAERLGEELPVWERSVDVAMLTHPQEDHVGGLIELLKRYDVRRVIASSYGTNSAAYVEWRQRIDAEQLEYSEATAGSRINFGDGVAADILWPPRDLARSVDLNNTSLVVKLTWGNVSFLLTGDIESDAERALLASGIDLHATVLKVAHHGSSTSSTAEFLDAVNPNLAVISVGANNPYGHPVPSVVDRLEDESIVLRTDQHGTVRLQTDGRKVWVEANR